MKNNLKSLFQGLGSLGILVIVLALAGCESPVSTSLAVPASRAAATVSAWTIGVSYTTGQLVTYNGVEYSCVQPNTALAGWEPPNVPALWSVVTTVPSPSPSSSPKPTPTPSGTPTTSPKPTPTPTATPSTTPVPVNHNWTIGVSYKVGDIVVYNGNNYTCRVANTAIAGWDPVSAPTLWVPGGVIIYAPAVPTGVAAIQTDASTVKVTWPAVYQAVTYDAQVDGVIKTGVTSPYSLTGLATGSTHTVVVRAVNTVATSAFSTPVSVTIVPLTPPVAPSGLAGTATSRFSIQVTWNPASLASSYDLQVDGTTVSAVTSPYSVSGLLAGTSHTFAVRGDNNAGLGSWSPLVTVSTQVDNGKDYRVGYFIQWGVYGRQYFVKNLDTSGSAAKLTHINYAFANIDPVNLTVLNGTVKSTGSNPEDPAQGDGGCDAAADYANPYSAAQSVDGVADGAGQPLAGSFNQLLKLKKKYPNLKVLMSIGGWTYSKYLSDVAATDASRKKFVASAIDAYINGNLPSYAGYGGPGSAKGLFDGFDIDWEWAGSANGHPGNHWSTADKANFVLLMKEFRAETDALNNGHYILTAFGPGSIDNLNTGWDVPNLMKYLDFVNVQGYDFHGAGSDNSWEPKLTGHQANLYVDTNDPYTTHFSCDLAITNFISLGANPRQLTLGIPFYGRGWQQVTAGTLNGQWQAANGASSGQFGPATDTLEAGTRETYNLNTMAAGTVYHNTQAVATFKYNGNGSEWWSFDDAWSIGQKMGYVKSKNLLGAMVWEMCGDDGTLMPAIDSNLP